MCVCERVQNENSSETLGNILLYFGVPILLIRQRLMRKLGLLSCCQRMNFGV